MNTNALRLPGRRVACCALLFVLTAIPKRQFVVKSASRAKVLNVNLDPHASCQYTNSLSDNERRSQATEQHDEEGGLKVLAAQAR
jgi:hypothetical protein